MAAIDLDRISGGRFILGLGTSVHAWTSGVFGMPRDKPVTHVRDTIAAIRHIVGGAHKGLEPFEGEYYRADFRELQPGQAPVRHCLVLGSLGHFPQRGLCTRPSVG